MDRKEAIEMLKAMNMILHNPDGEPISDVCDALDMAIEVLSSDVEWIPVSEGLPKKNDDYLVTVLIPIQDYNNVYYEESDIMFLSFHHGKFFDEFDTTDYHNFVTAWMPKPKPYKGSDEE